MTYCVGMKLNSGLVFMSDTRTNAGLDNISVFKKMTTWAVDGERVITLLSSGNLATTQAVISLLDERAKVPEDRHPSILEYPTLFQVVQSIGDTLQRVIREHSDRAGGTSASGFSSTMIVGGQIRGTPPRLFMVYPEGNFIEASDDTPFFQIGETKYGKPILVRAFHPDMTLADAVKLLVVSFDSTIKSNLSVGLPLDLHYYESDSLERGLERRIERKDPYYQAISNTWGDALRTAFDSLPPYAP